MEAKTLEALQGSIAKWEAVVDGTGDDLGGDNCPLCQMFNTKDVAQDFKCMGCPIASKTGQRWCRGTPYIDFIEAEDSSDEGAMAEYAEAEVDFLKSLLPQALAEEA